MRHFLATRQGRSRLLAVLLLAGLGVALAPRLLGGENEETPGDEPLSSRVLPVPTLTLKAVEGYEVPRSYTGRFVSVQRTAVAFERPGRVKAVLFDDGDAVAQGKPLARLDTRDLVLAKQRLAAEKTRAEAVLAEMKAGPRKQTIAAARTAVEDLESQLAWRRKTLERLESLRDRSAASEQDYDDALFGVQG